MSKITYLREVEIKFKRDKKFNIDKFANAPAKVYELFKHLENETKEKFLAIALDSKNKILCFEVVAIGSANLIHLRPIEPFRTAIICNAISTIMVHNHPSGDPKPSKEDIRITKRLVQMSNNLGFNFLDHIIIGNQGRFFSFSENDMLNFESERAEGELIGGINNFQKLLKKPINSTNELSKKSIK